MPIYLPAPACDPCGPDGQGRNRLRVEILDPLPQCALKPRTMRKLLLETYDTQHARWGGFGPCDGHGQCSRCPLHTDPQPLGFRAAQLAVRVDETGRPWIMHHLEKGWASYGEPVSLTRLANAPDYAFIDGRRTRIWRDADSDYVWLTKVTSA